MAENIKEQLNNLNIKDISYSIVFSDIKTEYTDGDGKLRTTYYFESIDEAAAFLEEKPLSQGAYFGVANSGNLYWINPNKKITIVGSDDSGSISNKEDWLIPDEEGNLPIVNKDTLVVTTVENENGIFKSLKIGDGKNDVNNIPYVANLKAGEGYASIV